MGRAGIERTHTGYLARRGVEVSLAQLENAYPFLASATIRRGFCTRDQQRTSKVALAGAPNAGKSTLVNALVGHKVSAVSQKTNTTFRNTAGYFQDGSVQVILYDTPGVVTRGQYRDQKHGERVESAWGIAGSCSVSLLVIDAHRQYVRPDPRVVDLLEGFRDTVAEHAKQSTHGTGGFKAPGTALVFTKIDKLLAYDVDFGQMTNDLHRISRIDDMFCVSGLRGQGMQALKQYLCSKAEPTPWLIEKGAYQETYGASIVKEVIREKIFRAYYKEIPYCVRILAPEVSRNERGIQVRAMIAVPSSSMKTIVVGAKGSAIASVERAVSRELEKVLRSTVSVTIGVQVTK